MDLNSTAGLRNGECRFFGGYGEEDTARALGISLRTVQRDWLKARAWLYRELTRA